MRDLTKYINAPTYISAFIFLLVLLLTIFIIQLPGKQLKQITGIVNTISPTPPYESQKKFDRIIAKNADGTGTIVLEAPSSDQNWYAKILQWNSYLLIFQELNSDQKEQILVSSYDLNTKQSNELLNITIPIQTTFETRIINDELFLIMSGYLEDYGVYYSKLPSGKLTRINSKSRWSTFEEIRGAMYLKGGFGDSCFSSTDYAVFDPQSKHIYPTISSNTACAYGTQILGFDKDNKMLIAVRDEDTSEPAVGLYAGVYKEVYRIEPKSPDVHEKLISQDIIPKNIKYMKYYEDEKVIAMFGDGFYLYNLETRDVKKIGDAPDTGLLDMQFYKSNNGIACVNYSRVRDWKINEISVPISSLDINLVNGTISNRKKACPEEKDNSTYIEETFYDQLHKLNLPSNYQILYK